MEPPARHQALALFQARNREMAEKERRDENAARLRHKATIKRLEIQSAMLEVAKLEAEAAAEATEAAKLGEAALKAQLEGEALIAVAIKNDHSKLKSDNSYLNL